MNMSMSRGCEHAIEHIHEYLDGEIPFWRRARIRMHLWFCSKCTNAYEFEAKLKRVIAERGAVEPPPELSDTVRALIEEERQRGESGV